MSCISIVFVFLCIRLQVERSVRCGTMRAVAFEESSDHCQFVVSIVNLRVYVEHTADHC